MCCRMLESRKVPDKAVLILCNFFETTGCWLYLNSHFMQGASEFLPDGREQKYKMAFMSNQTDVPIDGYRWEKLMIGPITIALMMEV